MRTRVQRWNPAIFLEDLDGVCGSASAEAGGSGDQAREKPVVAGIAVGGSLVRAAGEIA